MDDVIQDLSQVIVAHRLSPGEARRALYRLLELVDLAATVQKLDGSGSRPA